MSEKCYLDIETLPARSPAVIDRIAATIKPPASIKKAETLEKWEAETKPQAIKDALAKTSFDPAAGQICTIAWSFGAGNVTCVHDDTGSMEAELLRAFFAQVAERKTITFVGHFIGGFDLRFILCRAVVLGVTIPPNIPRDPKPWDKTVFDTMTAWAGARGSISLDNLCAALGIEGKGDFDGSMVADAWERGEHQTIIDYCTDDVRRVRAIHQRFQEVGF